MKTPAQLITLILFFLASSLEPGNKCYGQTTGDLDPDFNSTGTLVTDNGYLDLYQTIVVQPDGKIVAAGTFYDAIWSASIQVVRLLENGSYDPDFGTNGIVTYHMNYETGAYACKVRDDGKILVAGITTDDLGSFAMIVIRLNDDGSLDPDFGNDGTSYIDLGPGEDIAYAMALQPDEKILLSGYSNNENFLNEPVVVRLNEDGSMDTAFGENGVATIPVTEMDNEFASIALQSDGKIVAAGHISNGLSWFSLLAARFDTLGHLDSSFGSDGILNLNLNNVDDEFFAMQILKDDRIMLSGFTTISGSLDYHLLAMRLTGDGNADPSFSDDGIVILDENPYMVGNALVIQPDDKILIAGTSGEKMPMNNDWALWRLNEDGSPDDSFGKNGTVTTEFYGEPDEARAIALTGNRIVVAGKARNGSQNFNFAVARYINDIGVSIPEIVIHRSLPVFPNPMKGTRTLQISEMPEGKGITTLGLENMDGKTVYTTTLLPCAKAGNVSLTLPKDITPGIYTLKLLIPDQAAQTARIIVVE